MTEPEGRSPWLILAPSALAAAAWLGRRRRRESDDVAAALLDLWAVAADALSFYQERVANEGFLRTASARRSIRELAGLVGYPPAPPPRRRRCLRS